jgi:CheY-like chemotaxis protein
MKRRILLVDDDLAVLLTLKAVLELHGFEVETAASSAEAFARMDSGVYQMVISDLRMETEDAGLEVIRRAHRQAYDPATALLTLMHHLEKGRTPAAESILPENWPENWIEEKWIEKMGWEKIPTRCSSNRSAPVTSCVRWKRYSSATLTSNSAGAIQPLKRTRTSAARDEPPAGPASVNTRPIRQTLFWTLVPRRSSRGARPKKIALKKIVLRRSAPGDRSAGNHPQAITEPIIRRWRPAAAPAGSTRGTAPVAPGSAGTAR